LTHGNIIGTYVPFHYHNDVRVKFNYVPDYNDRNDAISEKPINICTLKVYNPKSHIYS
jgi:hypothetical protein